jgi:hypothetical protein
MKKLRKQPNPKRNRHKSVYRTVEKLLKARELQGIKTYGTSLQPFNGRNAVQDALEEAMDLVVYLTQLKIEMDHVRRRKA